MYIKRHTVLILMPTYVERCTHVHRTTYARTPNAVCTYTVRRTSPFGREAATKRAKRKDGLTLKEEYDYMYSFSFVRLLDK